MRGPVVMGWKKVYTPWSINQGFLVLTIYEV